ncbi:unnamed protein product [Closterium sp. NIES-53]
MWFATPLIGSTSGRVSLAQRVDRPVIGQGPLVLRRIFVSGAALRMCAIPLRTSSQLAPSPVSSLVSWWTPPDFTFYHPPLHRFLDLRNVTFNESVSYYARYPYRGLLVPPAPLFLAPCPPPSSAPPVEVDSTGAATRGADTRGARYEGVGVGGTVTRGAGAGGASSRGAGAGGTGTRGASSGGAGAGGNGTGGASSGGAGAGGTGTRGAGTGGPGAGGNSVGGPGSEGAGAGAWRPLPDASLASSAAGARGAGAFGAGAAGAAKAAATDAHATTAIVATVVPTCEWSSDPWSPFLPSGPLTATSCLRSSSSGRVLSCFLPSSVTAASSCCPAHLDHSLSPECSCLVSFTRCLDYATHVMASFPTRPLPAEGESTLGRDIPENRQFELDFLAATSPHLCAMLLALEGDPDALETPSAQQLHEWYAGCGRSGGAGPCTYVFRTGSHRGETCGLPHTAQRCFGCLTDAWRAQFPDAVELPRWHDLLRQNVPIYDLDFDAILAAMCALTDSAEGDCYLSVPPDPGIEVAALGASASAAPGTGESAGPGAGEFALAGTAPTEALHTFTLDSGASHSFFRDSTTLTPLSRPVAVSLADPFGGPVLAHSSTVLPCPAAPSGFLSGLHLPSFSTNLVSGADLQDASVDPLEVAASSQVFAAASRSSRASAPRSCRPLSHETLLWHQRLGHPSPPRFRGMASRTLVSGLPQSLSPLPLGPAPTCVPCVEGRQRAAPHSSTFPPTQAPLQILHMDVWGPARVRGQGHERYFLLVVEDYSRYTTVFPLRSKGEVTEVLIDWIRGARGQLSKSFGSDLPVLRLHSDRGVRCASDQPSSSCLLAGDHTYSVVDGEGWRCVRVPCLGISSFCPRYFSGQAVLPCRSLHLPWLPPNAPGWQFYHPTSRRVLSSQDVPFDESGLSTVLPRVLSLRVWGLGVLSLRVRGLGGAQPECVESGGAEPERVVSGGAEPTRAEFGGSPGVPLWREPLSPQRLREWYAWRCRRATGAAGGATRGSAGAGAAGGAAGSGAAGDAAGAGAAGGAAGAGAVGGATGAGAARGAAGAGAAGGAAGAGAAGGATGAGVAGGAAEPGGARTGGTGAAGAGGAVGVGAAGTGAGGTAGVVAGDPAGTGAISADFRGPARLRPYYFQPTSPLPGPSPCSGPTRGLTERREPESRPVSPESPSSLPNGPDPEFDSLQAASPTVTRFLATAVTDPLFESTAVSALDAELFDFAAAYRLDFATVLFAESASASVYPPSVGGECALGMDVLENRQEEFECFAAAVPHLVSMLLVLEGDPCTKHPDPALLRRGDRGTTLAALGFAPSTADPSLFLRTDTTLPPFYVLVYVDDHVFATADTEALAHVKSELQKRHTCTDLGELTSYLGLRITRDRAQRTITLTQSHMLQQVLQRFGFTHSSPQSTPLPTGHSLSAPPSDESVEPSGPYPELVGCLMYPMTCTRPDLAYPLSLLARYVAPGRHRKGYTFSLGSGSVSWRSTRSSSVLSSSCEAEIYAGAMAAQELRWLTYLLTDLGEAPRSPPVLYVNNKPMLALCQEHRLEHRTKHIALRYFLARELQQRGQLHLDYVASQANTADVFTKALQPCDHQPWFVFLD